MTYTNTMKSIYVYLCVFANRGSIRGCDRRNRHRLPSGGCGSRNRGRIYDGISVVDIERPAGDHEHLPIDADRFRQRCLLERWRPEIERTDAKG